MFRFGRTAPESEFFPDRHKSLLHEKLRLRRAARAESLPMNSAGTKFRKSLQVLRRRVPFMLAEAVARKFIVELRHEPVPRHLGQNARRRDRETPRVTIDQRRLPAARGENVRAVNE